MRDADICVFAWVREGMGIRFPRLQYLGSPRLSPVRQLDIVGMGFVDRVLRVVPGGRVGHRTRIGPGDRLTGLDGQMVWIEPKLIRHFDFDGWSRRSLRARLRSRRTGGYWSAGLQQSRSQRIVVGEDPAGRSHECGNWRCGQRAKHCSAADRTERASRNGGEPGVHRNLLNTTERKGYGPLLTGVARELDGWQLAGYCTTTVNSTWPPPSYGV